MSVGTVQVQRAPLVRAEALYLLGGVRMGRVACVEQGLTVHLPGFHALVGAEPVVRTPMGTEVDPALEAGLPVISRAESLDERSLKDPGELSDPRPGRHLTLQQAFASGGKTIRATLPAPANRPSPPQK